MAHQITPATEELLSEVEFWLDEEEAIFQAADAEWEANGWEGKRPPRGFRCNWNSTKKAWSEQTQPLDMLIVDGRAIGFLAGTNILEIHPKHRGLGHGTVLADFMLKRAYDAGYSMVEIELAPPTSEPFWVERMGFASDHEDRQYRNGLYAQKFLDRTFALGDGPRVPVQIEFYGERERYSEGRPFRSFSGEGERLPDGSVQLPERVHGYDRLRRNNIENHARIVVDGQEIYFARGKNGEEHGVDKDPGGSLFIDRVKT